MQWQAEPPHARRTSELTQVAEVCHTEPLGETSREVRRQRIAMVLRGTGVSAGVAQGTAYVLTCGYRSAVPQRSIRAAEVDGERRRLDSAVATSPCTLRSSASSSRWS